MIFAALLVTTAAATLSLALLAVSRSPFQRAFDAAHGAHIAATVDIGRAGAARIATSTMASGVTESFGPFPEAGIVFGLPSRTPGVEPASVPATVVGRGAPGGPMDRITLEQGRWVRGPGEVVLGGDIASAALLGSEITVTSAPGSPRLAVVGIADSITGSADAWAEPEVVTALRPPGSPARAQLLYRFTDAASTDAVHADVAALRRALGARGLDRASSWLAAREAAQGNSALFAPIVLAFAVLGLGLSVLIVGSVVGGAVLSGYRRIGVLKSLGFSPTQVVGSYLVWVMVPGVIGCAGGAGLGGVLAVGVLSQSSRAYGVTSQPAPAWVFGAAPSGVAALAALAALVPALRAGRLSAARAIATGTAPRGRHGRLAHRLLGRLRWLPRPLTLGLAAPFARPLRTAVTFGAIVSGTVAVIFATGLDISLVRVADAQTRTAVGQVGLMLPNPARPGSPEDVRAGAVIAAQPGTAHYLAEGSPPVTLPGIPGQVHAHALLGDASWTDLDMTSGRWFAAEGEIVVNTCFLEETGSSVGDAVEMTVGGRETTARIVGEVFDPEGRQQATLYAGWDTLGGTVAGLMIDRYDIGLLPGVDRTAYAEGLTAAFPAAAPGASGWFAEASAKGGKGEVVAVSLVGLLTLMTAAVAVLGVLGTVLQSARERVHDLGVYKAVGMTPRQTMVTVLCWVVGPGLLASAAAVPIATALHTSVLGAMAANSGTGLPADIRHVYTAGGLVLVGLAGLAVAGLGALLPAAWAAGAGTATTLRTE